MIPKSFSLGPHHIKVKKVGFAEMAKEAQTKVGERPPLGLCAPSRNMIFLRQEAGQAESFQAHTYWHEVAHMLMWQVGRMDLYEDEVLVDTLGLLLAQYHATVK